MKPLALYHVSHTKQLHRILFFIYIWQRQKTGTFVILDWQTKKDGESTNVDLGTKKEKSRSKIDKKTKNKIKINKQYIFVVREMFVVPEPWHPPSKHDGNSQSNRRHHQTQLQWNVLHLQWQQNHLLRRLQLHGADKPHLPRTMGTRRQVHLRLPNHARRGVGKPLHYHPSAEEQTAPQDVCQSLHP